MRRLGQLLDRIAAPENLRLAFWKAARGKWAKAEVRHFSENLEGELQQMQEGILEGDYPVGEFHRLVVKEPKERVIQAATFTERVLHHTIMNLCEPVFERLAINDSYACRRGKGQWAAFDRAVRFGRLCPFYLKMDVRRYFDSVPHCRLNELLERRPKDRRLLAWFARLIGAHETIPGRGLPIGSLTS